MVLGNASETVFQANQSLAFPWGVCVGNLVVSDSVKNNALLPTISGGLIVLSDAPSHRESVNIVETATLSLVDALPHRAIEVHVVDFAIRKRFQRLSALAAIKQYRVYENRQLAANLLEELESLARFRHHELLGDATPTLSEYNRQARGFERYHLLLLNLNDFSRELAGAGERLLNLLDAAFDAGIFLLAYANEDSFLSSDEGKDGASVLLAMLAQRYPQVRVALDGHEEPKIQFVRDRNTKSLLNVLKGKGLSIDFPIVDLSAITAHRLAMAASSEGKFKDFLSIPVGETLDGRNEVKFSLGARSDCNSAFMVGISGSGKTTLLNNLIVGIAEQYTSEDIRLYLMDYKDGVEFQVFSEHPNCEKIFLDNRDLDSASRMLNDFRGAIGERGRLFREAGVKDIDGYNDVNEKDGERGKRLPRLLLIVDEVQCLLTDNSSGRYFNELLKDVVRRGRAFGVHIILSTQTLINANVDRDLMSQIALRVAFKLNNDTDCEKIFSYSNTAPRYLDKFEFIYNADSGHRESNVRVRSMPPSDISERIRVARSRLSPELRLTAEVYSGQENDEVHIASKLSETAEKAVADSVWFNIDKDEHRQERDALNERVLAHFQKQLGSSEVSEDSVSEFIESSLTALGEIDKFVLGTTTQPGEGSVNYQAGVMWFDSVKSDDRQANEGLNAKVLAQDRGSCSKGSLGKIEALLEADDSLHVPDDDN